MSPQAEPWQGPGSDAVRAPAVVVERDESEFARLSQLGDILGLNVMEVGQVHKELAEQAFRNQVSRIKRQADALLAAEHAPRLPDTSSTPCSTLAWGLAAEHAQPMPRMWTTAAQHAHRWHDSSWLPSAVSFRLYQTWGRPLILAVVRDCHQHKHFTLPCVP